MSKVYSKISIKGLRLVKLLFLLSIVFISKNAFSRDNWTGKFTKVTYDAAENSITFRFEVFDYFFGTGGENGYLRWCDFFYTTDGENYTHLMRAETDDQGKADWTWLKMRYKKPETKLQFVGCYEPANGYLWTDDGQDIQVKVKNDKKPRRSKDIPFYYDTYICFFTVKWFLGDTYKDVIRIRLNGFWKVNGLYVGDEINNVYYDIPTSSMLKSANSQTAPSKSEVNNSTVKVSKADDAIVINGAKIGENVKVFSTSGIELKSMIVNSDVVNIKLSKNNIYIIKVGQSNYKVAL